MGNYVRLDVEKRLVAKTIRRAPETTLQRATRCGVVYSSRNDYVWGVYRNNGLRSLNRY